jgi:hypothetical protein
METHEIRMPPLQAVAGLAEPLSAGETDPARFPRASEQLVDDRTDRPQLRVTDLAAAMERFVDERVRLALAAHRCDCASDASRGSWCVR